LIQLKTCASTVVSLLQEQAERYTNKTLFRFLESGDPSKLQVDWSYQELALRAQRIAAALQGVCAPGDRVLLLFAPGLDFISAYFGCLYAGVIAVPIYPPDPNRLPQTLPRMQAIAASAGAKTLLTTQNIAAMSEMLTEFAPDLAALRWLAVDSIEEGRERLWRAPSLKETDVAFLQYTSGSTGEPRGVVITHGNLLANLRTIQRLAEVTPDDIAVSWLPFFHDLGLIGKILGTIYSGCSTVMFSPLVFLKHPLRWLHTISHFRATISGGPDFAYALCARRATHEDIASLDLSSWRIAFSGGEPIQAQTLARFAEVFQPAKFSARAYQPGYGLAESTLVIAGVSASTAPTIVHADPIMLERGKFQPTNKESRPIVSCGEAVDCELRIVSPEGTPLPEGQVGEIWARGDSVARGYWSDPTATAATFGATIAGEGPYLRTGDLGFFHNKEIFITGRCKDLLIIRGRNIYPQDIERIAERASKAIRPGCGAAFSLSQNGEESLGFLAEVDGDPATLRAAYEALQQAFSQELQLVASRVVFIAPRAIFKTSSGKIQRSACQRALLQGELEPLFDSATLPAVSVEKPIQPKTNQRMSAAEILSLMKDRIGKAKNVDPATISSEITFAALGVDSLKAAELSGDLETALQSQVPPEIFFGTTLQQVAEILADGKSHGPSASLDLTLPAPAPSSRETHGVIFLTGATGFLGAYLLSELLRRTSQDVVCLVRAASLDEGLRRIKTALSRIERFNEEDLLRVRALLGDVASPQLGLSKASVNWLMPRVSSIYHCAASVNWAAPLEALRAANVESVREILHLAAPNNAAVHFISSLGVYPFESSHGEFIEDTLGALEDLRLGYFQSKWVAEKLLEEARKKGFQVSIYRPGLIAGDSVSGLDTEGEGQLFYSFLRGCIELGSVPRLDKALDLIPVDYTASAIIALSLKTKPGGSYNLFNSKPMNQLALYRSIRERGFSLQELPYAEWREQVMTLPKSAPKNPLARFAGYYKSLTELRMRTMERRTASRLPVRDDNTQKHLGGEIKCPPFDDALLCTYLEFYLSKGMLPKPQAPLGAAPELRPSCTFVEEYKVHDKRLGSLYSRGKQKQWDAEKRIDWSLPLDPENPQSLPDVGIPIYGSALFDSLSAAKRGEVRRHFQAWQLSQFLHGEQGALLCAAKLVEQSPEVEGKLFAATQVADEARHLEVFSRLLNEKFDLLYPVSTPLKTLLDQVLRDSRWDMTALGMQVLVEGLALAAFSLVREQTQNPLIRSINAYVIEDEARHVAFGRMTLQKLYPALTEKERDEREEFVVEASYLLRDRFQGEEVWEALGLPVDRCVAHLKESGFLRTYRAELFSRIVPVIRSIGLWGPKVKKAYGAMGILGFAQVDVDLLSTADEKRAAEVEQQIAAMRHQ
jgi:thioester reductase-like protein